MGDLGGSSRPLPGGTKPRPLGQVKTENLQFQTASTAAAVGGGSLAARPSLFLPVPSYPPDLRRGPSSEEGALRASIKSMREIRENLRQAALLNIVAAANNEGGHVYHQHNSHHHHHHHHYPEWTQFPPPPAHDLRLHFLGASPAQLTSLHHQHQHHHSQSGRPTSPLNLHQSPTEGAAGMYAGSVTYPPASLKRDPGDTSPLPQNLVANLLSPRMRTISIPRPGPRATDLSGPFIHKSLTQAKECLSRVGEMVRSRTEGVVVSSSVRETTVTSEGTPSTTAGSAGMKENVKDTASSYRALTFTGSFHQRSTIPEQQGQVLERSDSPVNDQAVRIIASGSPSRVGSAHSPQISAASAVHPSHSASSSRTATEGHSADSGTRKGTAENRTGSGHRALSVRRHLSPRKKRELVKRLTEMAKCEAVDMSKPFGMQEEHGGESRFMPPMIILSQQRQEIRCPGESSAETPAQHNPVDHGDIVEGGDGGMHRAKSMSSLHHSNSHPYPGTSRDPPSQQQEDHSAEKPGRLMRAASGSMPDLVMEGRSPCSARNQRDMKRTDSSDWAAAASHAFTEGIVGKTLLKEKESGDTVRIVESRPFVLFTPKYRSRRGTRPSSRRCKIGLRDRGPPPDTSTVTSTTTTTIFTLNPNKQNRFKTTPSTSQSSEHQPPPSPQNLPVLTITGLNRERPPPGTPSANSRAAREFRPTSRAGVTTSSLQFFQRLDDECEKLQRQLNISLNMPPRRAPHWQILSRADLPSHHQPHSFSLPYEVEDADASTSSNLVQPGPNPRQDPAGAPPLSDVDEQSHVDTIRTPYTHTIHCGLVEEYDTNDYDGSVLQNGLSGRSNPQNVRDISTRTPLDKKGGGGSGPPPPSRSEATDPVLQSKKEPRYQGFSSRVPESEVRSQFHYITPGSVAAESETAAAAAAEEEREMKYRVLKALDQDVYYDFQHRKYRNTPGSTPVVRCNNEEDRPRVHFYKVKVNGET